jgi:hypothetical protein
MGTKEKAVIWIIVNIICIVLNMGTLIVYSVLGLTGWTIASIFILVICIFNVIRWMNILYK